MRKDRAKKDTRQRGFYRGLTYIPVLQINEGDKKENEQERKNSKLFPFLAPYRLWSNSKKRFERFTEITWRGKS